MPKSGYINTIKRYSFLWSKQRHVEQPERYHFDSMQEVIPDRIVRETIGIDLGCGHGWDTFIMARNNPSVRIIGMDISDSAYAISKPNRNPKNAVIIKGSATDIPLKDEVCDFIYSFGVLHHTDNYKKGFLEMSRVLKKGSPAFLYLYEDHSENLIKYVAIKMITIVRKVTVRIPARMLYILSCIFSPIAVILFTYPAKIFKRFKGTNKLYEKMPFNFGSSLFSLRGDIYDRFAAPIEIRFNPKKLYKIFKECNFINVQMTKLRATAGWVVWAYKRDSV